MPNVNPSRCNARALTGADCGRTLAWRNSTAVRECLLSDELISEVAHRRWFERILLSDHDRYWIVSRGDDDVGLVCLNRIDVRNGTCAWGGYVADPAHRGSGVGRFALRHALHEAFSTLGLHRVSGEVIATNEASLRLHRSLGFAEEGRIREAVTRDGVRLDLVLFGLLRSEWAPNS